MPNIGTLIQLPKLKTEVSSEIKRPIQNLVKHLRQTAFRENSQRPKDVEHFHKNLRPGHPTRLWIRFWKYLLFIYLFIYLFIITLFKVDVQT